MGDVTFRKVSKYYVPKYCVTFRKVSKYYVPKYCVTFRKVSKYYVPKYCVTFRKVSKYYVPKYCVTFRKVLKYLHNVTFRRARNLTNRKFAQPYAELNFLMSEVVTYKCMGQSSMNSDSQNFSENNK